MCHQPIGQEKACFRAGRQRALCGETGAFRAISPHHEKTRFCHFIESKLLYAISPYARCCLSGAQLKLEKDSEAFVQRNSAVPPVFAVFWKRVHPDIQQQARRKVVLHLSHYSENN